MHNIILIGMPTAGKSTVGVILAKVKGYQFVDSDLCIQEREKRLLSEIIEQDGIEEFLKIENEVNSSFLFDNTVIATGGSVVYGEQAMQHLRKIGTVVYIRLKYETIESRLINAKQRGVVLKKDQTLYHLYEERCPLYEKYAHITVDGEGKDVEKMVNELVNTL